MTKSWSKIDSVHGIAFFIKYDSDKIYEITSREPQFAVYSELPERFDYIANFLQDHTSQPMIIEAIEDLDLSWTTPFQLAVYRALATIPFGTVVSYGELASLAGHPKAARAVGSAMAKNRFMAVIPCHRVIASGGKIGGFSGGIELKKKLLSPEGF